MMIKEKRCFRLFFCLVFFNLTSSGTYSQCSNQVTHTSGSAIISGVSIQVTSFGTATTNTTYCPSTTPYIIGHLIGSGLTSNSGYTFQFSPPVDSITLSFSGISYTPPYQEIIIIEINGLRYTIPASGSSNGCDSMAVLTPQGTITGCNLCSVSGWNGTTIAGPITSVTVIDSAALGGLGGNQALFSLFFCNISSGVQTSNSCIGDSTLFTILNTTNLLGAQWDFGDPSSGVNNTSTLQNPFHFYSNPGNYLVQLIKFLTTSTDTLYIPVTIHPLPIINLGPDTTLCPGDSLVLQAGGGFSNYLWQDGSADSTYTAIVSGLYYVTVSDNTCSATDSISIGISSCSVPGIHFYCSDTSFCGKKCIDFFDISTNNPTSWQWYFPGADSTSSNLQNPTNICYNSYGTFDVTLIACNTAGCDTLMIQHFINEFQNPPIPVVTSYFDTLFTSAATTYQWFDSAGIIPGAMDSFYIYTHPGSYYVVITDSNGCASSSSVIYTGVIELMTTPTDIHLYPNPGMGTFFIELSRFSGHALMAYEITDLAGRLLERRALSPNTEKFKIDMSRFSDGLYFIRLRIENQILNKRILLQKGG